MAPNTPNTPELIQNADQVLQDLIPKYPHLKALGNSANGTIEFQQEFDGAAESVDGIVVLSPTDTPIHKKSLKDSKLVSTIHGNVLVLERDPNVKGLWIFKNEVFLKEDVKGFAHTVATFDNKYYDVTINQFRFTDPTFTPVLYIRK